MSQRARVGNVGGLGGAIRSEGRRPLLAAQSPAVQNVLVEETQSTRGEQGGGVLRLAGWGAPSWGPNEMLGSVQWREDRA